MFSTDAQALHLPLSVTLPAQARVYVEQGTSLTQLLGITELGISQRVVLLAIQLILGIIIISLLVLGG
jgi:hypothetical protein